MEHPAGVHGAMRAGLGLWLSYLPRLPRRREWHACCAGPSGESWKAGKLADFRGSSDGKNTREPLSAKQRRAAAACRRPLVTDLRHLEARLASTARLKPTVGL